MMPIRLIALDIDGTLLDARGCVPESNRSAIREAVSRGIEVVLVTGRRFTFALPVAEQIPAPLVLIANNGAVVRSKEGETKLLHLLSRETARFVIRATPQFRTGSAVQFNRLGPRQVIYEKIDWDDPVRSGYLKRNRQYLAEVSPLEDCLDEDPIQVMFTGSMARMRAAADFLDGLLAQADGAPEHRFAVARTFYESRDFALVDVIRAGISKGTTLLEWAAMRGISREGIMAIGDNLNDREMLESVGLPVVMGNSVPELKALGWRETLSVDEGGVGHAIEEYVLAPQSGFRSSARPA